jgi:hypothetical protein
MEVAVGSGVAVGAGRVAVGDGMLVGVDLGVGELVVVGNAGMLAPSGRGVLVGVGVKLAVSEDWQPATSRATTTKATANRAVPHILVRLTFIVCKPPSAVGFTLDPRDQWRTLYHSHKAFHKSTSRIRQA